jgi:hypothetical protein
MKIKINKEFVIVAFGIGILKKRIRIKELLEPIEIVKIPWYNGVGFRYMKNSLLLSTKAGESLKLKTLNRNVYIVSNNCKKIISVLKLIKMGKENSL